MFVLFTDVSIAPSTMPGMQSTQWKFVELINRILHLLHPFMGCTFEILEWEVLH